MNKKLILKILAFIAVVAITACTGQKADDDAEPQTESLIELKGDSTIYGLVCDGCTDSVLVMLPADALPRLMVPCLAPVRPFT